MSARFRTLVLASTLAMSACAAEPRQRILSSADGGPGFPTTSTLTFVRATARFETDAELVLGTDVTSEDVLPVHLRLASSGTDTTRLTVSRIDARLYLQDGTVLGLASDARVPARARARALESGPLPPVGAPLEGYLFFALEPGMRARDHYALVRRGAYYRELDLDRSLLVFDVETPTGIEEVRVGLRASAGGGP